MHASSGHQPRDPSEDDAGNALDALQETWGGIYDIWREDDAWCARPRTGPPVLLTCETPGELVRAMRGYGGVS